MGYNTNTTYAFLVGGGFSLFAYLIGGFDNLILSLAIFMGVDFVTGIMVGAKNGYEQSKRFNVTGIAETVQVGISSKKAFVGLMKKSAMILAIVVSVRLDIMMGSGKGFLRNAMIMFFIGTEGISFIENLGRLGVNLPKQFTDTFIQLTQKGNITPKVEKQEVVQPFSVPEETTEASIAVPVLGEDGGDNGDSNRY